MQPIPYWGPGYEERYAWNTAQFMLHKISAMFFRSHLMSTLTLPRPWNAEIPHVNQDLMASCCLISITVFLVMGLSLSYPTNLMMLEPTQEFTGIAMKLMPANLPTLVQDSLENSSWTLTDGTSFL